MRHLLTASLADLHTMCTTVYSTHAFKIGKNLTFDGIPSHFSKISFCNLLGRYFTAELHYTSCKMQILKVKIKSPPNGTVKQFLLSFSFVFTVFCFWQMTFTAALRRQRQRRLCANVTDREKQSLQNWCFSARFMMLQYEPHKKGKRSHLVNCLGFLFINFSTHTHGNWDTYIQS